MEFSILFLPLLYLLLTSACLLEVEQQGGHVISRTQPLNRRQTNQTSIPIGTGDRFNGGSIAPRGIGSNSSANFSTVYNLLEIKSAVLGLVKAFRLPYFTAPYKTYENNTMFGFKLGGKREDGQQSLDGNNNTYTILLEAGIHARERGGPDHLINFASDLLWAHRESKGLQYAGVFYTPAEVARVLDLGIVILPLVNPDGVAYDHGTNLCWRKNRNATSAKPGDPDSIGIDLNRNFDPVWNFTKYLAPGFPYASDDPSTELFRGTAPLSEAEARNIDWTMETHPNLGWFADLHSPLGVVIHGWCHDSNQAKDASMSVGNKEYDGKRGVVPDNSTFPYKEYIDPGEWDVLSITAARMAGSMIDVLGRNYRAIQAAHLYPTSGCSLDHGRWRALAQPEKRRKIIKGLGIEYGVFNEQSECQFYPTGEEHRANMLESGVAFMELLLAAARLS